MLHSTSWNKICSGLCPLLALLISLISMHTSTQQQRSMPTATCSLELLADSHCAAHNSCRECESRGQLEAVLM
jgi:hypothetical protein